MKIKGENHRKKICYVLSLFLTFSALSFVGCSKKEDVKEQKTIQSNKKEEVSNDNLNEKLNNENKVSKEDKVNEEDKENSNKKSTKSDKNIKKFTKHKLEKNVEPQFSTKWNKSINKKLSACIEGKGPEAEEEGIGKIYIKDSVTSEKWSLEISTDNNQDSPKFIEWLDDENMMVVVGKGYGTVDLGGNLYKVNAKTAETTLIYDTKEQKKQVISAKKVNDKLELQILVYHDDDFIKSHTEKKTINIK